MESAGDCENIRMKRLFKRITALASAAALTLSLAACGGSAVSGPKNTAPTNAKPVTITVWTYYYSMDLLQRRPAGNIQQAGG